MPLPWLTKHKVPAQVACSINLNYKTWITKLEKKIIFAKDYITCTIKSTSTDTEKLKTSPISI